MAQDTTHVPSLSSLHFSSLSSGDAERVLKSLEELAGDEGLLKDEYDTFRIEKWGTYNMGPLTESLPESKEASSEPPESEGIVDYQSIIKRIIVHEDVPSSKTTPYFNHHAFYSHLRDYQAQSKEGASLFGSNLLYGEVVTSTNTILEK